MNGLLLMLISIAILGAAYIFYGGYLCKTWGIDAKAKTPAFEYEDGVDYVPADTQIVFGHQFASIAGAGPITGPIQAAVFGWVPVLLWILIGGIFFGAVQDFVAMYASVKNKGRTIGYIIEEYIGKLGKKLFLLFTWLFCILVIAVFADLVAKTFASNTGDATADIANGSVAMTSCLFIIEAVMLGLVLKFSKLNKWANTGIALAMLVVGVVIGLYFPILNVSVSFWHTAVFIYILIACVTPVWALLQPRDYLNSYLLIFMIMSAVIGVVVARPSIQLPAFTSFYVEGMGYMFPILFVTIACGAVSGFHALVSSGTSSKQIKNEKHMLPVSFGAMLLECVLAVIALVAVASFVPSDISGLAPATIFAAAIANFLEVIGLPYAVIFTLINLAVSAFALTSLDSVARVARLSFQELFLDSDIADSEIKGVRAILTNKYFATALTLVLSYGLAQVGYASIWPLFGSANQLLSALALISCAVFLKRTNRKGFMIWIPMCVMLAVTLTALSISIYSKVIALVTATSLNVGGDILQLSFGIALFVLGVIVAVAGFSKLVKKEESLN